jgi:aryl-alcohol dehydrogenase-like predicted oxidoreductase
MEYRRLGQSGLQVPVLSFGTATFGGTNAFFEAWGRTDVEEAQRLIAICLEADVTLFDTADGYSDGRSEEILGKALGDRRQDVLIATKAAFRSEPGANGTGTSRHHLIRACEASLRRLNTDYIDLYQMHAFDALTPIEETLRALDDLVRAGKIRYIGCSNFSGWQLMKALAIAKEYGLSRYIAHQVSYSLLGREFEWELMPLAIEEGVGSLIWGPLAGGQLSGKISRNKPAPATSRMGAQGPLDPGYPEAQLFDIVDVLQEIATARERTVAQVALNWLLQRPTVSSIIIGARNEEQLRTNLEAVSFNLTKEEVERLDTVSARPLTYPYWHQRSSYPDRNPVPV